MDDHDLGALLDASVPAAAASDEALSRIHRRAGQRRRRTALAGGVLTVVVAVGAALGVSWVGGSSGRVAPGGPSSSVPSGTTTIMPDGRCFSGDVSLHIDTHSTTFNQTTQWAVYADNRSDTACRVSEPIKATIHDSNGQILSAVSGTLTAAVLPNKPGYVSELAPDASTLVGQLVWILPCSNGPVELEVAGFSPSPARLKLPRQACIVGIDRSRFSMLPVGDTVAGETCPFGSLTLSIDPQPVRSDHLSSWEVHATTRTRVLCRVHSGVEASIEDPDGTVLRTIAGNPASQQDRFRDLLRPKRHELVAVVTWSFPCSAGTIDLVVRYEDSSYGHAVRLRVPPPNCLRGPGVSFLGIGLDDSAATTTTATTP